MVLAMQQQANLAALHGYADPAALSLAPLTEDPRYSSALWPAMPDSHLHTASDAFGSPLAMVPQRGSQTSRHGPVIEPSFPTNVVIANPRASMASTSLDWSALQHPDAPGPHQHRAVSPQQERMHPGEHESSTDALRRELMMRHQEVLAQQQPVPLPGFRIRSNASGIGGPLSGLSSAQVGMGHLSSMSCPPFTVHLVFARACVLCSTFLLLAVQALDTFHMQYARW